MKRNVRTMDNTQNENLLVSILYQVHRFFCRNIQDDITSVGGKKWRKHSIPINLSLNLMS